MLQGDEWSLADVCSLGRFLYIAPSIKPKQISSARTPLHRPCWIHSGFTVLILSFTAFHCAGQAPPAGGPPDTTPPAVTATYPEQGATSFDDTKLSLEFSEYVDRRSVEESIFISPTLGSLEFDWSGREVEIHFDKALAKNVTYVVTVGTDVIDVRARNRMAQSFTLAFSTGSSIDSASLSGRVFDAKPEGVTVYAYKLNNRLPDTLNPSTRKPDYLTQTGNDGSFRLEHLAWGSYRLYAVRDEFKNLLYDPQTDLIGMASRDFSVDPSSPSVGDIQFRLTMEDTAAPFLANARAVNRNLAEARFSEALYEPDISRVAFTILDTTSDRPLGVRDVFYLSLSPASLQIVTDDQDSTHEYRLTVTHLRDTAGNTIRPTSNAVVFQGSSLPDTIPPMMIVSNISDSMRNVPYNVDLDVRSNEFVSESSFETGFRLLDSLKRNVSGRLSWSNPAMAKFRPAVPLLPLAWYSVNVVLDSVKDYWGNRRRDSVFTRNFQTIDWRKLGSIRGRLSDPLANTGGPIIVSVKRISDAATQTQRFDRTGDFTFENLEEGLYRLEGFRDTDTNGVYTYGAPFPYMASERFTVYPDTIKIRARWPVEGVVLQFKKN